MNPPLCTPIFRTTVRERKIPVVTLLIVALAWGLVRGLAAFVRLLRNLPRSNDEMVFF
jgi:hypothetical protein